MNFQYNFRHLNYLVWLLVAISVAIMFVGRAWLFINVADVNQVLTHTSDLWRLSYIGIRFDFRVATIAFAPLLLIGLICAKYNHLYTRFLSVSCWYSSIIFFLLTAFTIGNYYYYQTYGNYFDVFIFGLFDDDTKAVIDNIWTDYPIIFSFILTVMVTVLSTRMVKSFAHKKLSIKSKPVWVVCFSVIMMIVVYVTLARGSWGSLPLKRYHANVSQYAVMNKVTPNAFMALDWARTDYRDQAIFKPVSEDVVRAQMKEVLNREDPLYHTPKNTYLEQHQPHVVMALMESMGMNVLVDDNPKTNDLLASLRPAFEQDFLFTRFQAGTTATIDSLMMMLLHSNIPTISHSSVQNVPLKSSAVLPYKRAGYDVSFIYGGNGMWRNLSNYLPLQGFDHVYDEISIKKAFPEAEGQETTWGVADEFVFKFAEKLLKESDKPQMIYIMTTTNHTPYQLPNDYQPNKVTVTPRLKKHLKLPETEQRTMLETYQYSSNALGEFIQTIKHSDLRKNTLVAASGDHRVRSVDVNIPTEDGIENAVPFYLYIPPQILANVDHKYDSQRIGSHRDIFPTLYHFSLSEAEYISLGGQNILSEQGVDNIGYNQNKVMLSSGVYNKEQPELLYPWAKDKRHTPATSIFNEHPEFLSQYYHLQDVYLRSQVADMTL